MSGRDNSHGRALPRRFRDLVRVMPPQATTDDVHYENTLEMIDRLMARGKLSRGQELYLETLVQLVGVYESQHHAVAVEGVGGIEVLRHLLTENGMNASDLARLLGVHPSMGSKILKGERSLTVDHLRKLAERFAISPALFMERQA